MRPLRVGQTILSALLLLFTCSATTIWANARLADPLLGDYAAPEGIREADAYAHKLVISIKQAAEERGLELKQIQVYLHHQGKHIPSELQWIATTLGHHGIPFQITRWHKRFREITSEEKINKILEQRTQSELWLKMAQLPDKPKWATEQMAQGIFQRVGLGLRHFFRLPRGFWVLATPYFDKNTGFFRPSSQQWQDLKWYGLLSAVTAGAVWSELAQRYPNTQPLAEGAGILERMLHTLPNTPEVAAGAAILTSVVTRVVLGYLHRANTAFFNLGSQYRHDLGRMANTQRWSLTGMFVHSFFASSLFQFMLHQGNLSSDVIENTVKQGLIGAFAKVLPNRYTGRREKQLAEMEEGAAKKFAAARLIGLHLMINGFLEVCKYGMLVGVKDSKSWIYLALAAIGAVDLVWEHYTAKRTRTGNSWASWISDNWSAFKKRLRKDLEFVAASIGLSSTDVAAVEAEAESEAEASGRDLPDTGLGRTQIFLKFPGCQSELLTAAAANG